MGVSLSVFYRDRNPISYSRKVLRGISAIAPCLESLGRRWKAGKWRNKGGTPHPGHGPRSPLKHAANWAQGDGVPSPGWGVLG